MIYVCEFCRNDFEPRKAENRFCSKSCAAKRNWPNSPNFRRKAIVATRFCESCRSEFKPKQTKDRFCSKSCAARWNWQNCPKRRDALAAHNRRQVAKAQARPATKYHTEVQARLAALYAARKAS